MKSKQNLLIGPAVYLGILTSQGLFKSLPYGLALFVIAILFNYVVSTRKIKTLTAALMSGGVYLGIHTLSLWVGQFYLYDFMMGLFEGLAILVTVYIVTYAMPILQQQHLRKVLSTEEIICVAILMALALSGVNDIRLGEISLKNVLGILITIIFAHNGGAGVGASIGVTLGLIISMSAASMPPLVIGIFAFSGLLSGIFKDVGKIGSAFGFLIGNTILTFYINGYYEVFIQWQEVFAAFIAFLFVPKSWLQQLQKYTSPVLGMMHATRHYGDEMQRRIQDKLGDFSSTYNELSASLENMTRQIAHFGQEDLSLMLDKMALSVCHDCGMKRVCWESNFFHTYQGFQDLVVVIETKGMVDSDTLPEQIRKRCIRPQEVTEKLMHLYELNRLNMLWKKKLLESKELVGEQLRGVAQGITRLASDLKSEILFDQAIEDTIYVELDKAGLSVRKLVVSCNQKGSLELQIVKKPCYQSYPCSDPYVSVISQAIGQQFVVQNHKCNENQGCQFTLVEAKRYQAVTKVARATKGGNRLSGDAFTFMEMPHEGLMVALSDGMGTGERAHRQSSATINMLEKMMEAGFGKEMSIKTINSMLMLKSTEEIFSTIDMAMIDLHQGIANFVKIGSASSYIKRSRGQVEKIDPASLPVGIVSDIEVQESSAQVKDGDFIVMVSDGILEVQDDEGEEWLTEFLSNLNTRNPQELADKILYQALSFVNNQPKDDMTVLVTKIWNLRNQ